MPLLYVIDNMHKVFCESLPHAYFLNHESHPGCSAAFRIASHGCIYRLSISYRPNANHHNACSGLGNAPSVRGNNPLSQYSTPTNGPLHDRKLVYTRPKCKPRGSTSERRFQPRRCTENITCSTHKRRLGANPPGVHHLTSNESTKQVPTVYQLVRGTPDSKILIHVELGCIAEVGRNLLSEQAHPAEPALM